MSTEESIDLGIDPGRLLYGLSRIGYTTTSAICDIIDNSVRAKAQSITLLIRKEREDLADSKKNNVREYVIVDNGVGMNNQAILDALTLGASDELYDVHSLSKFGLGLKSAAFSQGDILKIISSNGNGFNKYEVSLPKVMAEKKYTGYKLDLDADDQEIISKYLTEGKGTIIKVSSIRKNNHPSVKNTVKELITKIGVVYYYFISEEKVEISISEKKIAAIDPLFVSEASENDNLNENEWDGTNVAWIEKPKQLLLEEDENISVKIEITQMPYPPIFKIKNPGESKDAEIREKYLIGAGNYGFYVYRNKRLISWASSLDGIITQDQDYYSFRGRILIDDLADDFFNVDVKKSTITLSDEAWNIINDFTREARSKSKAAWIYAGRVVKDILNENPSETVNKIVDEYESPEILPGDDLLDEGESLERIQAIQIDMAENVAKIVNMVREDKGETVDGSLPIPPEEVLEAIKGTKNPAMRRVFRVTSVVDNYLWEPYHDTDLGSCVRINRYHRFARLIYEDNSKNQDLQIFFDLILLQMAEAELYAYTTIKAYEYKDLKNIMVEFRRIASEFLAHLVRKLEDKLPPKLNSVGI